MKINCCTQKNPLDCSRIKIDKKSHYAVITAVALVAIGLVALGLAAHFLPQSALALRLGALGSYGSIALGGVVLMGITAILVRNAIHSCAKNEDDTAHNSNRGSRNTDHSEEAGRSRSNSRVDTDEGRSSLAGSVVIHSDAETEFNYEGRSSLAGSVVIHSDAETEFNYEGRSSLAGSVVIHSDAEN